MPPKKKVVAQETPGPSVVGSAAEAAQEKVPKPRGRPAKKVAEGSVPEPVEPKIPKRSRRLAEASEVSAPEPVEPKIPKRSRRLAEASEVSAPEPVEPKIPKRSRRLAETSEVSAPEPVEPKIPKRSRRLAEATDGSAPDPVDPKVPKRHLPEATDGSTLDPVEPKVRKPRGVPPKKATHGPAPAPVKVSRPRGRLPEATDDSAPEPVAPKRRGRVPKIAVDGSAPEPVEPKVPKPYEDPTKIADGSGEDGAVEKRKVSKPRGGPPTQKVATAAVDDGEHGPSTSTEQPAPKRRGRPPKKGALEGKDEGERLRGLEVVPKDAHDGRTDHCSQGSFDALPDELLEVLLAAVRMEWDLGWDSFRKLLSLRLVCRRWSRAMLSPAVWRHRRIVAHDGDDIRRLRLVPSPDSLWLCGWPDSEEDMLRALVESECEVPSLKLTITTTVAVCGLLNKLLQVRRATLRELDVTIIEHLCPANAVLAVLDASGLQSLTLQVESCFLKHEFHILALERLKVRGQLRAYTGATMDTLRSLVTASRDTLLEADCGELVVAPMKQLAQCSRLRSAVVIMGPGLSELLERPQLEALKVRCRFISEISLLMQSLGLANTVPRRLTVVLHLVETATLRKVARGLCRVQRLELDFLSSLFPSQMVEFSQALQALENLEELALRGPPTVTDWFHEALLLRWTPATLPALKVFEVEEAPAGSREQQQQADSLDRLKALRPDLNVVVKLVRELYEF